MGNFFITFLASFLIWILFAGLFVLWVIDGRIKKEQVLHALFAMFLVYILTVIIKDLFPETRPFIANNEPAMTLTTPNDASFPSTHTAIAFALGTSVFLHDRHYGWKFFLGAAFVAIGRILANVHYPSDIIAGALLGMMVAWATEKIHLFGLLGRGKR